MSINITQHQKEIIESRGHYVIEFKLWCKKVNTIIKDVWRAIIVWLNDVVETVVLPAFRILSEKLESVFDYIDKLHPHEFIVKKQKWNLCKKVVNHYRLYIKRSTIYHCRNNC